MKSIIDTFNYDGKFNPSGISILYLLVGVMILLSLSVGGDVSERVAVEKETSVKQTTTYYCTAPSNVNVRIEPKLDAQVVGKLAYGEAVEVILDGVQFSKIKFKHSQGEEAWVSRSYISKNKPAEVAKKKEKVNSSATATAQKGSAVTQTATATTPATTTTTVQKEPVAVSKAPSKGTYKNYEYVDMGLSVMWATCNVGAVSPLACGGYFAYGEVTTKTNYSWDTYKYGTGSSGLKKYNSNGNQGVVDGKNTLDREDDAATINMGGQWRTPTKTEIEELIAKCQWEWVTVDGNSVLKAISKINGNYILFSCNGYMSYNNKPEWGYGNYMSSTLNDDNCNIWKIGFNSNHKPVCNLYARMFGYNIRPVVSRNVIKANQ